MIPETAVQPKETKEAKEFEGFTQTRPLTCRVNGGCLFGDVAQADVIKLHKASGKVTFLIYDDFENTRLPQLNQRIKVNLRTHWVQVFDHSAEGELLYFKERFVGTEHPWRAEMQAFSGKLQKLGFDEDTIGRGPLRAELVSLLESKSLNQNLNLRRGVVNKRKSNSEAP